MEEKVYSVSNSPFGSFLYEMSHSFPACLQITVLEYLHIKNAVFDSGSAAAGRELEATSDLLLATIHGSDKGRV